VGEFISSSWVAPQIIILICPGKSQNAICRGFLRSGGKEGQNEAENQTMATLK
jgi:hypothetical protein